MKHSATIQCEFLKEARKWKDLSYEDQKGYLRRHPKSKRKLTARPDSGQSLSESSESHGDTILDFYNDNFKGISRTKAEAKIRKLKQKIQSIMARGERGARRWEDAGPIDIARELADRKQAIIDVYEFAINNPDRQPPQELLEKLEHIRSEQKYKKEQKEEHQHEKEEHADLMGKIITWTSRKNFGREMTGRVTGVKAGKHGAYVKTDNGWKVPVSLITKTKQVPKEERGKVQIKPEELIGKRVSWKTKYRPQSFRRRLTRRTFRPIRVKQEPPGYDPSKGTASGIVEGTKGSKVIVGGWRIPLTSIEQVDNKAFEMWKDI